MITGNRFIIGQYRPGGEFLHRLDPRTKVIMVAAVMVTALLATDLSLYAAMIAILLVLLISCRLGWGLIFRNLRPVVWFVLFTAGFHLLFSGRNDPEVAFALGSLTVSRTALMLALTFSARILIFVLATFVVSLTTSPVALSEAVVSLLLPLRWLKAPVYDLGMILFIALRFIPVLADEIETIRKAQQIRGYGLSGGLRARIKSSMALILPVFFSALRRADDLAVAIDTRGYKSGRPRSSLEPLRFAAADYAVLAMTLLTSSAFIAAGRMIG